MGFLNMAREAMGLLGDLEFIAKYLPWLAKKVARSEVAVRVELVDVPAQNARCVLARIENLRPYELRAIVKIERIGGGEAPDLLPWRCKWALGRGPVIGPRGTGTAQVLLQQGGNPRLIRLVDEDEGYKEIESTLPLITLLISVETIPRLAKPHVVRFACKFDEGRLEDLIFYPVLSG